ncbi:glycosyltransferase [Curtobacterium sp. NPDC089185]|uniref:glycosyltransferase n=1 Tax=Curtobacterium sp. NPDC089185 TaxID=3154968 RepID=UPI003427FF28
MRKSRDERNEIVFAYAYAESERDAVARVVRELATELRGQGMPVRVLGIPAGSIVASGGGPADRVRRMLSETTFLLRTVGVVFAGHRRMRAFVSVDVPSGLPLVGALARIISSGRVRDAAWVMDLYRLAAHDSGLMTKTRSAVELFALQKSGSIVTIGSCMAQTIQGLLDRQVHVIPLWHRPIERHSPVNAELPLRLLYSGSAREVHPLRDLVAVVAERDDVELTISGSGSEVEAARRDVSGRGIGNVTIREFAPEDELEAMYAGADLHIVSLAEELTGTCVPSKVYAAMGAGRGVFYLGSPTGQAAVDVLASGAGVVVGTRDGASINDALDNLVSRPKVIEEMARRSARFFDANRTIGHGAAKWAEYLVSER